MHCIILVRRACAKCSGFLCSKRTAFFLAVVSWCIRLCVAFVVQIPHFHIQPTSYVQFSPSITTAVLTLDPNPPLDFNAPSSNLLDPPAAERDFTGTDKQPEYQHIPSAVSTTESYPLSTIASQGAAI